jgi:hypothetical protein
VIKIDLVEHIKEEDYGTAMMEFHKFHETYRIQG